MAPEGILLILLDGGLYFTPVNDCLTYGKHKQHNTQEFKMTNCRRHKFTGNYANATCTFRALNRLTGWWLWYGYQLELGL